MSVVWLGTANLDVTCIDTTCPIHSSNYVNILLLTNYWVANDKWEKSMIIMANKFSKNPVCFSWGQWNFTKVFHNDANTPLIIKMHRQHFWTFSVNLDRLGKITISGHRSK